MIVELAGLSFLIGLFLGRPFRVLVLLPLLATVLLGAGVWAFLIGADLWSALAAMVAGTIGLQVGYVLGSLFAGVTRHPRDSAASVAALSTRPTPF